MNPRLAPWVLTVALTTCVGVTEERSRRDEQIGKGEIAGASFQVSDGLAAIRLLESGRVTLWAKAPQLDLFARRSPDAPETWTLTIDNTLPDAVLEAATSGGETIAAVPLEAARATEKRWTLTLPANIDATLKLRSARGEPTAPWRFALLSDIQEAIDRVQDIYARMNADSAIEFVVCAGDLTTQGKPDQLERFQDELEMLGVPFFATLGNHELGTDDGEPFQRWFGRANFRFVYGGLQFTFLDSASATLDPRVYDWLTVWLAEGRDRPHAAFMHIPPIDPIGVRNGSFASRDEAAKLLAKLAEGGVDATFYGHIHSYYAFSNAGIPAYIAGGGGAIPERFDGIGRHYLTVDVDPARGIVQTGLVRIDGD
ncbi:MAG TPA: metallophosphoesterase [Polyangiaceae bacterium]